MKPLIKLTTLVLAIVSAIVTSSCNKDDDETQKTKTELLTAGSWKRTALISNPAYDWNGNGMASTDVLSIMFPCEKDNFDTYKTNGVMTTDEGATKCSSTDPQTWDTTWELIDNESKILYDGSYYYLLVEVTETILKLRGTFVENGITYTHDESYSH
jgi:Tfp pilus assembly protein PilV